MKDILLILLIVVFAASCKKSSDNGGPNPNPAAALNTTEQKLIGTWFLKKEHYYNDPIDTIFTSFSAGPYVSFSEVAYPVAGNGQLSEKSKNSTDKSSLLLPNVGSAGFSRGATSSEQPWYCDSVSSTLIYGNTGITYKIIVLSKTNLGLAVNTGAVKQADTLWFEK